jgi:hypothetical protein
MTSRVDPLDISEAFLETASKAEYQCVLQMKQAWPLFSIYVSFVPSVVRTSNRSIPMEDASSCANNSCLFGIEFTVIIATQAQGLRTINMSF